MKIALANDHAGFPAREKALAALRGLGHEITDFGAQSPDSVDYPDFAEKACRAVVEGAAEQAILICGTGQGMAMAANRIPGIRAARCLTVLDGRMARAHNNANVLALAGWEGAIIDDPADIIRAWLTAEFEGGRHQKRLDKLAALDDRKRKR